jgi:hypothetical protein
MLLKKINAENTLLKFTRKRIKKTIPAFNKRANSRSKLKTIEKNLPGFEDRAAIENKGRDSNHVITYFYARSSVDDENLVKSYSYLFKRSKAYTPAPLSPDIISEKAEVNRVYLLGQERIWDDSNLSYVIQSGLFFKDSLPDDSFKISRLKGLKDKLHLLFEGGLPLKASDVAKQLHCDIQEINKLRIKYQILGVSLDQKEYFYPPFQFQNSKVLLGLEQVLKALKDYSPWTQLMFLKTGDIRLEGKTPLEILQKGDIEKVVAAANCYGVHGAA